MGIRDFFWRMKRNSLANRPETPSQQGWETQLSEQLMQASSDRRMHIRFQPSISGLLYVQDQPRQISVEISDLSYGGISISVADHNNLDKWRSIKSLTLCDLAQSHIAPVNFVQENRGTIAYSFIHQQTDTLEFLRPCLESMRIGASICPLGEQNLRDPEKWHLRGKGATDIMCCYRDDSQRNSISYQQFAMIFLDGDIYRQLSLTKGKLYSDRCHSLNAAVMSHQDLVRPDHELEKHSVEQALRILNGCPRDWVQGPLKPLVNACLRAMRLPLRLLA